METNQQEFAISTYLNAREVNNRLDALRDGPLYSVTPKALKQYEDEYFAGKCARSREMVTEARHIIPGGVQHNLAFNYPFPLAFDKAEGAYLYDVDGNKYYDFLQAGGPVVLGSNPPAVREKVIELLNHCGPSTGLFHEYEYKIAKKICDSVPSVDMFRMMGSGSEAVMGAARIARLATGNKRVVKMGGAYHGWSDQMAYSIRIPGSKWTQAGGVPRKMFQYTDEFFPNDLNDLEDVLKKNRKNGGTAAVFIEAIGPESGTRPVDYDFPKGVQDLCRQYGALLICDEVVTGFRIAMSGAQGYYGIEPDLTIFGKVVAGGYPGAGGIGGKAEYMEHLGAGLSGSTKKPKALVGGTMAATPISCVAGYYTLCEIEKSGAISRAGRMGDRLTAGLNKLIDKYDLPFVAFNQGSVCHLDTTGTMQYFIDWSKPWQIPGVLKATSVGKKEMEHMGAAYMAEGIVTLAGSRLYTSGAYNEEMIDDVLDRFERVFANVGRLRK